MYRTSRFYITFEWTFSTLLYSLIVSNEPGTTVATNQPRYVVGACDDLFLCSKCVNARWNCTTHECPALCQVIGEDHYITFDGKFYQVIKKSNVLSVINGHL